MKNVKKFSFNQSKGYEDIVKILKGEIQPTQEELKEYIEFLDYKKDQAKNKNSSTTKKEHAENVEILAKAIEILSDKQKRKLTEIVKEMQVMGYTYKVGKDTKEVTTSKLSSVFNEEIFTEENGEKIKRENRRVERIEEGKDKLYFTIKE